MPLQLSHDPEPIGLADRHRHILALSGGGIRGLFTVRVLEKLEEAAAAPCRDLFDLIAGTSVGGIIALALSQGKKAKDIRHELERLGPKIFGRRPSSVSRLVWPTYSSSALRRALQELLGGSEFAATLYDVAMPLVLVSIDETNSYPKLLLSKGLVGCKADKISLIDAALATSAAPTFFPAHRFGGRSYVDGGIIANAPDLVAVTSCIRWFGSSISDLFILSIGTAAHPALPLSYRPGRGGLFSWLRGRKIMHLAVTAQELLAQEQVHWLLKDRVLRIDGHPSSRINLDDVRSGTIDYLLRLADDAFGEVSKSDQDLLNHFLLYKKRPLGDSSKAS